MLQGSDGKFLDSFNFKPFASWQVAARLVNLLVKVAEVVVVAFATPGRLDWWFFDRFFRYPP